MAEARDFHCHSHVFENLGNQTIPSDHTAVRLVIRKPSNQGREANTFQDGCPSIQLCVLF